MSVTKLPPLKPLARILPLHPSNGIHEAAATSAVSDVPQPPLEMPPSWQPFADDFIIPTPKGIIPEGTITIDEATSLVFKEFGWPTFGGSSGRGWSYFKTATRCPHLFRQQVELGHKAPGWHPEPLQIGALFHTLTALHYAFWLGEAVVLSDGGGLLHESLTKGRGRPRRWRAPETAPQDFLGRLKEMTETPGPRPYLPYLLEAERLFKAHVLAWDKEDVVPLGIEIWAEHSTGYTCRFDMIGRVGPHDVELPEGIAIIERKTARWIDERYIKSWQLDGEVLGEVMCWGPEQVARFGPLAAACIDVVTKDKNPATKRIVLPPDHPPVRRFTRWISYWKSQIDLWRSMNVYPQNFGSCYGRYGLCDEWDSCARGIDATDEQSE